MAEDVGYALLNAARRMSISSRPSHNSGSDDSTNYSSSVGSSFGSGGWMDSWKSSNELDDKTGSLPKDSGNWFSNFAPRNRAYSESAGNSRMNWGPGSQRGGWTPKKTDMDNIGFRPPMGRVRRASTKDVEEAMAGGLNKADMYMPPI